MNATKRVGSSSVAAILAVFAVFAVVVSAIPAIDAATAGDASNEKVLTNWDLGLSLGYEAPVEDADHTGYWAASFDFSDNEGKWPYGNDAVMAVKFFFSDGNNIADRYSVSSSGKMYSSEYVVVPVFDVNGQPYVSDVYCTPELWPTNDAGEILAYPVQAEAVLYTDLYNEDDDNDKK